MTKRIATLNTLSPAGLDRLPAHYEQITDPASADAWLVRSADLHQVELPDQILAVARAGAGVNTIPLQRMADEGIVVFNTPGANANGVTELVIAALIMASRDVLPASLWLEEAKQDPDIAQRVEAQKKAYVGTEIRGKTLGVIGLGAVGHRVANAASSLGMEVLGYDPWISIEFAWQLSRQVHLVQTLEELFEACDYLTIHVPLTDKTEGLIAAEQLAQMKEGVILLNFARDAICDEEAVGDALQTGQLGRYVVDFPNPTNVSYPNTLLLPHLGASTVESEENCAVQAVQQLHAYLEEGTITNSVNYPAVSLGALRTESRLVVLHRNLPRVINKVTQLIGDDGYNIEQMVSGSRGDYACALLDVSSQVEDSLIEQLEQEPEILKLRVLRLEGAQG